MAWFFSLSGLPFYINYHFDSNEQANTSFFIYKYYEMAKNSITHLKYWLTTTVFIYIKSNLYSYFIINPLTPIESNNYTYYG